MREDDCRSPAINSSSTAVFQAHWATRQPRQQSHQHSQATLVFVASHHHQVQMTPGPVVCRAHAPASGVIGVHARLVFQTVNASPCHSARAARVSTLLRERGFGYETCLQKHVQPWSKPRPHCRVPPLTPWLYQVPLRVHPGGVWAQRLLSIKDGRQHLVLDADQAQGILREVPPPLPRPPHRPQNARISSREQVRINTHGWHITMRQHRMHPRHAHCLRDIDIDDIDMGMRAAQRTSMHARPFESAV